jgi:hypothetical protein
MRVIHSKEDADSIRDDGTEPEITSENDDDGTEPETY